MSSQATGGHAPDRPLVAPPGLAGVVVADTSIGAVDGQAGRYHYRGHDAIELARHRSVEEVWHLLLHGSLPDASRAAAFAARIRDAARVPSATLALLPGIVAASEKGAPLADLRTAVSALAAELGVMASLDLDGDSLADQLIRLVAPQPELVATLWRLGIGDGPVEPDDSLGFAGRYLHALTGRRPSEAIVRALERYLVLTMDHGFNASTFAARVVTSTGADAGAALVAAIGGLSGPLHGGAPSRALDMLDEIGQPDRAAAWARAAVARGERVMGFGHRIYRTRDPRAVLLKETATELGGPRVELAVAVEDAIVDVLAEEKPGRKLYANVEFYAAVVLEACGLPRELFTSTFALSRAIGWSAHIREQHAEGRLIRPTARYVGMPTWADRPPGRGPLGSQRVAT
ncbi:MAG: citrate synthase [Nitriliruptorales bacterium]|nr:citrate synthase [Nitriliruptorales bacterium]